MICFITFLKKLIRFEFQTRNFKILYSLFYNISNSLGKLYLLNTVTGRPALAQPIKITNEDSCISATSFNHIKYSMVGASCDDGSVAFWDVHTAKELQTFGEHKAPATGLAFSPVNEVLVASTGLDKRCVCYDTSLRKPVMGKSIEAPITSVDFAADGSNIVLGSSQVRFSLLAELASRLSSLIG